MRKALKGVAGGVYAALIIALVAVVAQRDGTDSDPSVVHSKVPQLVAMKRAAFAKFAPASATQAVGDPESWADQDWYQRSVDGNGDGPPTFSNFATARNDWHGLLGRPAVGTGKWVPFGPSNGINDLTNLARDRSVYNAGTENFGGRTVDGVIDKECTGDECYMWVANANGGVWMTRNALATDDPATRTTRVRTGSTSPGPSSTTTSPPSNSTRTTRAATRCGREPASQTPAAPAARSASAST